MKKLSGLLFLFYLQVSSVAGQNYNRDKFINVLDISTSISDTGKVAHSFFSDLGAWHAYAQPASKDYYGGFTGPIIMDMNGKWLSNAISKLHIAENGKELLLAESPAEFNYLPGLLSQRYQIKDLTIDLQLIFQSNRKALIQTKIINQGNQKRNLEIWWSGDVLLNNCLIKSAGNRMTIEQNDHLFLIDFSNPEVKFNTSAKNYSTAKIKVTIPATGKYSIVQQQSFFPDKKLYIPEPTKPSFTQELALNKQRWDGYLNSYFKGNSKWLNKEEYQKLAVKSIITLITNWRSASKDLKHDGVFPSASYEGFYGFWAWDSWKHAVALASFHPELAKSSMLSMFDYQNEDGMVADCIYSDKKENNWRDTKPPLAAWAVWEIYQKNKDDAFLKEIYPKLIAYHNWWYKNRDHNQNGLCEYGSCDGTRIAAAWESGMDNAVRFDKAQMLKNNDKAWSLNQESVDLNAYLYFEKLKLAQIATALGSTSESQAFTHEAQKLKELINLKFYDETEGYYFDQMLSEEKVKVKGPEAWIPLWTSISDKQQAESVMNCTLSPTMFNTKVPLPTLDASRTEFAPLKGYWRGPVWLDQFYFGVRGLKEYGFSKQADELTQKLFNNADGLLTDQPIRENYHPLTGKGLNALNFSWSAAHLLLLLSE